MDILYSLLFSYKAEKTFLVPTYLFKHIESISSIYLWSYYGLQLIKTYNSVSHKIVIVQKTNKNDF